eukprot:CAMPEP_0179152254 /NCGR_PEP_ID=MMETSP0796-20121207/73978_1 /TAXON_ID=73915 /ORGANISM="Pyrodinium bahamense, Strain pbaha01" /LENGTH=42 /DNA_ID= /DNA_START= /DNA_END= /DNA_ORIENTATION=
MSKLQSGGVIPSQGPHAVATAAAAAAQTLNIDASGRPWMKNG